MPNRESTYAPVCYCAATYAPCKCKRMTPTIEDVKREIALFKRRLANEDNFMPDREAVISYVLDLGVRFGA